ncbi:MAG: hypothetical protein RLZZ561_797 [Pseudomonadota bacterium]|jgi:hypothetical protein
MFKSIVTSLGLAAALTLSIPAFSQPVAASADAAADSARLAAATRVVDRLWPSGTYRRMMDATLNQVMDQVTQSMFGMKASDFVPPADAKAKRDVGNKTMAEMAEQDDPHFRERMKITMDVMVREMVPLIEQTEPDVRAALARIYARDYSVAQLAELETFLKSPTGIAFSERWITATADPEMMKTLQSFIPKMMQAMPGIMQKAQAATAHLPAPKGQEKK